MKTHRDNRKYLPLFGVKHLVAKVSLVAMLSLTLLGVAVGANATQAQAAEVAPQNYSASYMTGLISQVFGAYAGGALRVAQCESGLNPYAVNPIYIGNSRATGLFQILYPSTWVGTSQAGASPYDPIANARAAYEIFVRDGYSWREWVCQP